MQKEKQRIDNPQHVTTSTPTDRSIEVDRWTDEELAAEIRRIVIDLSRKRRNRVIAAARATKSFS